MVVPFPAGGPTDVLTRVLAEKAHEPRWDNPSWSRTSPAPAAPSARTFVAKSAPDGYTLVMATSSTHAVGPNLVKSPYDPVKDFTPIARVGYGTNLLVVSPMLGVGSVAELIDYAKKNPGKVNYATSGIGSVAHLTSELFASMAGIRLTHVPYKGLQLAIPDLDVGTGRHHVRQHRHREAARRGGRLKGIGVTSPQRSELMPNLPTVAAGLPGFESTVGVRHLRPGRARRPKSCSASTPR
jgi:tripartite-type tricarboxylate transporter receptor subunit TctC